MSFRILICWLFLLTPLAHAQVNIEKLRSENHEDGFSGSLSLKTTFTQGNIDFADFGMTGHLEHKQGDHLFFSDGQDTEASGSIVRNTVETAIQLPNMQ